MARALPMPRAMISWQAWQVAADRLATGAEVLVIVTMETAIRILVTHVVRMHPPTVFHVQEQVLCVAGLNFTDGLSHERTTGTIVAIHTVHDCVVGPISCSQHNDKGLFGRSSVTIDIPWQNETRGHYARCHCGELCRATREFFRGTFGSKQFERSSARSSIRDFRGPFIRFSARIELSAHSWRPEIIGHNLKNRLEFASNTVYDSLLGNWNWQRPFQASTESTAY